MPANIMMQPRSRWGFASPSKGLVNYEVREGHKQQLLQEAASLLPDYAKLTDTLLKNEMHYADNVRAKNVLDSYTQAYMENYQKNPYYSFSREGRNLSKSMQAVVQNPALQSLAQQYKIDQGRLDQADKDGVTQQYDVNENGIKVQTSDGQVKRKFRVEDGDTPLTIGDSYQYVHNITGGSGGGFKYDMSNGTDVNNNIEKAFSGIGDDKVARDILEEGKRIVQQGNNRQVNSRIQWLLAQGISQSDLNYIYADYAKKTGRFDINEAKKYAVHYINDYASGVRDSTSDISYIDDIRKGKSPGGSEKEVQLPTSYSSAILGSEGKRSITLATPQGNVLVGEGNILTNDIFKEAPKSYTEDGVENKSHKITDLDVFRKAIANGAFVPAAISNKDQGINAGDMTQAPKSVFKNMVISESEAPSLQVMIKDNKGNPASAGDVQRINGVIQSKKVIPQDLQKYFTVIDGQPQLNRGYFLHGQALSPRKRSTLIGSTSAEDKEASDYFSNLGHNSIDDDLTRQEYNQYNGSKDKLGSTMVGFDDQVYKVDVFIPVTNTEIFMGDKVRGTQDALLMGDTSRLQDPSTPVDKAYMGLGPFNQVTNPRRYSYFPNQ